MGPQESSVVEAALSAKLDRSALSHVTAKAHHRDPGKGAVSTEITVSLSASEDAPTERVSVVKMVLTGYPAGTTPDSMDTTEAVFEIDVEGKGFYTWKAPLDDVANRSRDLAFILARPIFLMVANEVGRLADRLGYSGVPIEGDLPPPHSSEVKAVKQSAKKAAPLALPPAKGAVARKATPKAVTSRKKQ
jgi:hypothetical protein